MNIAKTSPLYEYWNSPQDKNDQNKRLIKHNPREKASKLFIDEPYKWENLYQSVLRKVINGDESSIKALMILLSTLNEKEKEKTLIALDNLLEKRVIDKLRNENYQDIESKTNLLTTITILWNIFINPYGLEIKRNTTHIYERTAMYFFRIRKLFKSY